MIIGVRSQVIGPFFPYLGSCPDRRNLFGGTVSMGLPRSLWTLAMTRNEARPSQSIVKAFLRWAFHLRTKPREKYGSLLTHPSSFECKMKNVELRMNKGFCYLISFLRQGRSPGGTDYLPTQAGQDSRPAPPPFPWRKVTDKGESFALCLRTQ